MVVSAVPRICLSSLITLSVSLALFTASSVVDRGASKLVDGNEGSGIILCVSGADGVPFLFQNKMRVAKLTKSGP